MPDLMKNRTFAALCLYINYVVHGIGVLIMSLNMHALELQWGTDAAGVAVVISSLGLGRLSVLFLAGTLSDRWGRKPFVLAGMAVYFSFFAGLLFTQDIVFAYMFGFLAGCANSFLDAGTYPRLMELFPKSPGSSVILVKAAVSCGQFSLPLVISLIVYLDMWFGWSFVFAAAILVLNFLVLFRMPFAKRENITMRRVLSADERRAAPGAVKPVEEREIDLVDLGAYTLYGYIGMGTFYLVSQWLTRFAESAAGMEYTSAIRLLSIYTVGSLAGVFFFSFALKKFLPPRMMLLVCTAVSTLLLLLVCVFPVPWFVQVFSFLFGTFAAGGVVQLGLALMAEQFPNAKGKATGIYYSAGSISNFSIPLFTAWIAKHGEIADIFRFDAALAALGFLLAVFIVRRSCRAAKDRAAEA